MSSSWGKNLHLSLFGESHGAAVGVVLDSLPAGERIDMDELAAFMARRAPGSGAFSTKRKEADSPRFLSGVQNALTCGTPLCISIENTDTRSGDYRQQETLARPSHADFTGFVRYGGHNDIRGGGHFSGRLTAPLVAAGGIALQILARRGVSIGAHLYSVGGVQDRPFDSVALTTEQLSAPQKKPFPVQDDKKGAEMLAQIEAVRKEGDSIGGIVECAALGLPVGIGSPMFYGVENVISSLLFGIPAVKGVEFGEGFAACALRGSQNNDAFILQNGEIKTQTNRHGGILGGITSGMPLILRAAFKPTPSIAQEQRTVDFLHKTEATLTIKGRHDPCLAVRAVPCVEAAVALALLDMML